MNYINYKTTIILGAGASMSYGYPSGSDLLALIKSKLKENYVKNKEILDLLSLARPFSVDSFLNNNPDFSTILKPLIGRIICACEGKQSKLQNIEDDWIRYFFHLNKIGFENYRFITFNYDRCLEYNLYGLIKGNHPKMSPEEIRLKVQSLNIVHVHGRVPYLEEELLTDEEYLIIPYAGIVKKSKERPKCRTFVDDFNEYCNERILTVYEKKQDGLNLKFIDDNLKWAERIIFLGFGYLEENMDILNIRPNRYKGGVWGTSFGLGKVQINDLSARGIKLSHTSYRAVDLFKQDVRI